MQLGMISSVFPWNHSLIYDRCKGFGGVGGGVVNFGGII